jgi:hypothetical protein
MLSCVEAFNDELSHSLCSSQIKRIVENGFFVLGERDHTAEDKRINPSATFIVFHTRYDQRY